MIRVIQMLSVSVVLITVLSGAASAVVADPVPKASTPYERIAEWSVESHKRYADPFNDVDVDVIFERGALHFRVPMFWAGGNRWTVRFAPPVPGQYAFRLESTDRHNADLNGHDGMVTIRAYSGQSALLRHGAFKVSANKRYLEHADGTPFYWLGDIWWTGLSDRISWPDFQKMTADRAAKKFTAVLICGGLVPYEELAPVDPGFHNEGGYVWDRDFKRINPAYFDYADRRIQYLVNNGIAPAIVGGWHPILAQMGVKKMEQHWRYLVARYGAYPVFWVVGGEVYDPPPGTEPPMPFAPQHLDVPGGWSEVARYLREVDPYNHPITVHEGLTPHALQSDSLTDFDLAQASHFGWASIAMEVAQITARYARTSGTKPAVEGEVTAEGFGGENEQSVQRAAFWLAMLNGAAGYTYGTEEIMEAYTSDRPLHRERWSLLTWQEGLKLPGSSEIALNAGLLRQYPWQRFTPHPDWVIPRGTALLDGTAEIPHVGLDLIEPIFAQVMTAIETSPLPTEAEVPKGEWHRRKGTFRLPYAAGIPGEVRVVYMPYFGPVHAETPTVLHLEPGVRYSAYLWEPSLGIKFDLGVVQRPEPGRVLFRDSAGSRNPLSWATETIGSVAADIKDDRNSKQIVSVVKSINEKNVVTSVEMARDSDTELLFRYRNSANYISAVYSSTRKLMFIRRLSNGKPGPSLGAISVVPAGSRLRFTAELRDNFAMASLTDGSSTYSTPIVYLDMDPYDAPNVGPASGSVGVSHTGGATLDFDTFEVRASPTLVVDKNLERELYDAKGKFRGAMRGTSWDSFGRTKALLLDAYRPDLPYSRDWILVLDTPKSRVGQPPVSSVPMLGKGLHTPMSDSHPIATGR